MKQIQILLLFSLFTIVCCNKQKDEKVVPNNKEITSDKFQIKKKKNYGQNEIKKAIELDEQEFVNFIDTTKNINHFYQFETSYSYTILGYCCKLNRYDFVKKILSKKADILLGTQDDAYELDALYVAIENQNEKIVNLLLENKAKVNSIYTESGLGPLSLACKFSNFKIIETLVNHNADIKGNYNPESEMASFPILEATISKNKEAIKLLIEKGADINQVDLEGVSALSYAKDNDQEIYNYLMNTVK